MLAISCLTTLLATPAEAQQARAFNIPRQGVRDALLDLALQSRRSLGGEVGACRGESPAVHGAMSLETALDRVLAGSGCTWSIGAGGAVIIRRVAAAPAPTPRHVAAPVIDYPGEASQLSDIVVTAERRPDTAQQAPVALTALSGDRIGLADVTDLTDVSSLVAGMTVTNLGSGRNKILLRGMSDGAFTGLTQSTVAIYLDLAPITYSAPDPDLKLIDVDRVEVLRGPQGTLYGTGPIGGVVRIVTHRPNPDNLKLELSATNSWTHSGGQNTDYSATGNLPLLDGRLAVRGSIYEESFGGYINDVNLNLHRVNDGSRHGGRIAVGAWLNPDWSLTAGYVRQAIKTEDTHYVYRVLGGLTRANLVREPHENQFEEAYVTLNGQGDWGRLDASVAAIDHDFTSRYDASSALITFLSLGRIGALDEAKNIHLLVGEATLHSPDAGPFRWLAGGFFSTSRTPSLTTLSALRPLPVEVIYTEDRLDKLDEMAVFGELSLDLRPDLTATVGARYYRVDYSAISDVNHYGFHRPFIGDGDAAGLSPKFGLDYRFSPDLNLYALISQGHRTGGFNTAGPIWQQFTGRVGMPAREYKPDTLWNYEVGAKARLWDGQVQARIAAFVSRWKDIQSDQFLPSGLAYAVNVGDGANKGLELEANWQPSDELILRFNTLLADPAITRPSPAFNSKGDAGLPGVPAISANLNASYRRPLWRGLQFTSDAVVTYVGASRLTFDASRRYRMGDYITGRLSAGIEGRQWTATAFVDNPADTEANTFSFGDPFRLPEALATTPLRPRTIGLTLTWAPW
ncbi:MAG: TonB-dependent receptor [Caulobacteraceae bacterium]|nr:TonB-dependent receptor [Caulobacteraceae bacterium]